MGEKEITKSPRTVDMQEVEADSDENFQNVICEILEKNGVMNDLRAYLRQNIVNVLRSTDTGEPPACQKHFTQRLELTTQAADILIAEYLLRFDFSYSLSVFIAEIPLANMVFDFAKDLMMRDEASDLRFNNKDISSILNYLGIKCDSNFVQNVLDTYNNSQKTPLLVCILKNLVVFTSSYDVIKSETNSTVLLPRSPFPRSPYSEQSDVFSDTTSKIPSLQKCRHCHVCQTCASRLQLWKEKYLKAKLMLMKNQTSIDSVKTQQFLNNIHNIEGNVINEMFDDMRLVYDNEIDNMRTEEERREMDRAAMEMSLRQELEASYKAREAELESNVRVKKQFLWELARSLRAQHEHVARAARAVTRHAHALKDQEAKQMAQLGKIESALKRRGEELQHNISTEMIVLEEKLDAVRSERHTMDRERDRERERERERERSFEQLKEHQVCESPSETSSQLLGKELTLLKKYIETPRPEPKCLIDRSTITDLSSYKAPAADGWNNEQDVKATREDDRVINTQVVNDLKKKNVNFCAELTSVMRNPEESSISPDSGASRVSDVITQLKQENERLKEYARQQELQVQQLSHSSALLRAELSFARDVTRPHTAPATLLPRGLASSALGGGGGGSGGRGGGRSLVGAGEELSLLVAEGRPLLPGEPVPFIGLLRDRPRRPDSRRLLNQWQRSRRISPLRSRHSPAPASATQPRDHTAWAGQSCGPVPDGNQRSNCTQHMQRGSGSVKPQSPAAAPAPAPGRSSPSYTIINVNRTKSVKSVIREAKEKLRNHAKAKLKCEMPSSSREKSPASVLREAKQKLRKLEIEAEAVERSYFDYKKRQQWSSPHKEEALVTKDTTGTGAGAEPTRPCEPCSTSKPHISRKLSNDIDSYLTESIRKLSDTQFSNRNIVTKIVKPIPGPYSEVFDKRGYLDTALPEKPTPGPYSEVFDNRDYLETPLPEFRKYYQQPQKRVTVANANTRTNNHTPFAHAAHATTTIDAEKEVTLSKTNAKVIELEILENNVRKMYSVTPDAPTEGRPPRDYSGDTKCAAEDEGAQLRIEVEPAKGMGVINVKDKEEYQHQQNLVVIVQSKVDTAAGSVSTTDHSDPRNSPPKLKERSERSDRADRDRSRSMSPEQAARLTRNDVLEAIFHKDTVTIRSSSNVQCPVAECVSKDNDDSIATKGESYEDDFSGDADNYNSRSSPVSLPASPPDEAFWNDV